MFPTCVNVALSYVLTAHIAQGVDMYTIIMRECGILPTCRSRLIDADPVNADIRENGEKREKYLIEQVILLLV